MDSKEILKQKNEEILQRILELMSERGLSDREVESILSLGKGMVSHWRYENRLSFLRQIIPLCQLLNTNPNFLFLGTEQTDDPVELSPNEKDLIRLYRSVDDERKKYIREGLRLFTET